MSDTSGGGGGTGPMGLLFVLFVALKLTHVIAWSWWWVTAPIWGSIALTLVFMGICLALAFFTGQVRR